MNGAVDPATLSELAEYTEGGACADLLRCAPPEWNFHAEITSAGVLLVAPGLDIPLFNRLAGVGLKQPATEQDIDTALGTFSRAGIQHYAIQVSPTARPREIETWLADRGLSAAGDNWAKVIRDGAPAAAVQTDLRIQRIDPSSSEEFARVACEGFRMPPHLRPWFAATVGRPTWHHYLAFDGPAAVAAAALRVEDRVGWLGVATTLPSHRRRGAQAALMARRIDDGRALGCEWFVTETGEDRPQRPNPSYHNMVRAGFRLLYQRPNFMSRRDRI